MLLFICSFNATLVTAPSVSKLADVVSIYIHLVRFPDLRPSPRACADLYACGRSGNQTSLHHAKGMFGMSLAFSRRVQRLNGIETKQKHVETVFNKLSEGCGGETEGCVLYMAHVIVIV